MCLFVFFFCWIWFLAKKKNLITKFYFEKILEEKYFAGDFRLHRMWMNIDERRWIFEENLFTFFHQKKNKMKKYLLNLIWRHHPSDSETKKKMCLIKFFFFSKLKGVWLLMIHIFLLCCWCCFYLLMIVLTFVRGV